MYADRFGMSLDTMRSIVAAATETSKPGSASDAPRPKKRGRPEGVTAAPAAPDEQQEAEDSDRPPRVERPPNVASLTRLTEDRVSRFCTTTSDEVWKRVIRRIT